MKNGEISFFLLGFTSKKFSFLKKPLVKSILDQKVSKIKKLRIAKIHYHKKIQVKNFKNEGDIKDLVILLVTKNFLS